VTALINRSLAYLGLKQTLEAERDLTRALELDPAYPLIYFIRARVHEQAKASDAARRDLAEGLRRPPPDERTWIARAQAQLVRDPKAALADFDQVLRRNPRSRAALQFKAHVLSEQLGRTPEAIQVLDRTVELYPDDGPALAGRGVLQARLGLRDASHRDAETSMRKDPRPATVYRAANCYALTSRTNPEDAPRAIQLLSAALAKGYGFDLLSTDPDLEPIRTRPEFQPLLEAAKIVQAAKQAKPD
jgi:tetratricopeptide (TPR) repeat protein